MVWKAGRVGPHRVARPTTSPFSIRGSVGKIENPPARAFKRRYIEKNRPVIVTGAMDTWRAMSHWDDDYLTKTVGMHGGEVIISENGLFPDYITKPEPMAKKEMPFAEFLRRVSGNSGLPPILTEDEAYYIYGKPYLFQSVPALKADAPLPACISGTDISSVNLWMSASGCITPLHYDLTNGLLAQIRGRKKVYLFDPKQFDSLYFRNDRFPGMDNYERQSRLDIHNPDWKAFPRFREAAALVCTLNPGEILFLPSNWPHEVETLETSISVGFTFAGGTATSQFATMADRIKSKAETGSGDTGPGPIGDPAEIQRQLEQNPEMLLELMNSPLFQELLQNPEMIQTLLGGPDNKK